ncbi:MAG: 3-oxoacid CoA-transferase subunit B [Acuticoccus sp.]
MSAGLPDGVVPRTRNEMAARLAADIPEGWWVNLGIGLPTLVADHVPSEREVIFQSENGILGMGPAPAQDAVQPWLVNAGKQPITLRPGGSYFHQADSFTMIRGGHLDLCVLGAYQVAANGDIANWSTNEDTRAPAVGGAMDLAAGARRLWVLMDHVARGGAKKLVTRCTLPLTATACVARIYTNLAVLAVEDGGFTVLDTVPGLTCADLAALTDAPLNAAEGLSASG